MKKIYSVLVITIFIVGFKQIAVAQETTLASGLGLYVFPAKEQNKEQQDADELSCYKWAKEQTGVDPINPPEVQAAQVDRSADGTAVVGAARGAAAGAAITSMIWRGTRRA